MNITLRNNQKETLQNLSLEVLIAQMKQGKYIKLIEKYQNWIGYGQHLPRPKYVNQIPSFCLNEVDPKGELTRYNGMIHLYIRNIDSAKELKQLREQINASPHTLLSYNGLSLSSLHFICRYSLPPDTADGPELPVTTHTSLLFHAHAYNDARKYYQKLLKQPLSFQEPSLTEWYRFTYDDSLYYNPQAECVQMEQPLTMPGITPDYTESLDSNPDPIRALRPDFRRDQILSDLFDNCFNDTLEKFKRPGTDEDLHEFLSELARLCYRSGIPEADCVKWAICTMRIYPQESRVSKIVHNIYGYEKGGFGMHPCITKEQKLAWQLKDFVNRRYELRYNELKQCVEYVALHDPNTEFQAVDERVINDICFSAHEEGVSVWDKDVRRLIGSHFARPFNPLTDYVMDTPRWDGHDHIGDLARRIPTGHPKWPELFHRWFLSLVAHWIGMDSEHANSVTPQLLGGPGERKSTFCRMIMPPELWEYYTDHLDLSSLKSATRMLGRFGLIN